MMKSVKKPNLTDEIIKEICEGVSIGMPYSIACQACGVSSETCSEWWEAGKLGTDQKCVDLYNQVKAADDGFINEHLEIIKESAKKGNRDSSSWLRERGIEF